MTDSGRRLHFYSTRDPPEHSVKAITSSYSHPGLGPSGLGRSGLAGQGCPGRPFPQRRTGPCGLCLGLVHRVQFPGRTGCRRSALGHADCVELGRLSLCKGLWTELTLCPCASTCPSPSVCPARRLPWSLYTHQQLAQGDTKGNLLCMMSLCCSGILIYIWMIWICLTWNW